MRPYRPSPKVKRMTSAVASSRSVSKRTGTEASFWRKVARSGSSSFDLPNELLAFRALADLYADKTIDELEAEIGSGELVEIEGA